MISPTHKRPFFLLPLGERERKRASADLDALRLLNIFKTTSTKTVYDDSNEAFLNSGSALQGHCASNCHYYLNRIERLLSRAIAA